MTQVALAHDYLTQRGGAERVVLAMAGAFPGAPLYTTLFHPAGTFREFAGLDVRVSPLNRVSAFRKRHRWAMPLLAPTVSAMRVEADVLLASSSGWAHAMPASGRKIVYCHAPARWLYQQSRYLGQHTERGVARAIRSAAPKVALATLGSSLRRWDGRAAASADVYLANSTVTRDAIRQAYGIEAEIVPPPPALLAAGPERTPAGVAPGYVLCVARLLPYKNVDAVIRGVERIPGARLIVVGDGPERAALTRLAGQSGRATLLGRVEDDTLRWLYRNCAALVAASFEDYGLSPLEAAGFGRPSVVMRAGGYLDTVVEGRTGVFFDRPVPDDIAAGVEAALARTWQAQVLTEHAEEFGVARFQHRLRQVVARVAGVAPAQQAGWTSALANAPV